MVTLPSDGNLTSLINRLEFFKTKIFKEKDGNQTLQQQVYFLKPHSVIKVSIKPEEYLADDSVDKLFKEVYDRKLDLLDEEQVLSSPLILSNISLLPQKKYYRLQSLELQPKGTELQLHSLPANVKYTHIMNILFDSSLPLSVPSKTERRKIGYL